MLIDNVKFALDPGQYFAESMPKTQIVLHFTAGGTASGAFETWKRDPVQVATAFIVDKDGKIYQCFNPSYWAYHLGVNVAAGNVYHKFDRQSIGIEMVNWGGLKEDGFSLNCWPNNYKTFLCQTTDTDKAYVSPKPWRGFQYWNAYTEAQLASVYDLVHQLCRQFVIPLAIPRPEQQLACDPAFAGSFKGIVGHQMYLGEKTDPGPAFPWEMLMGERPTRA